MKKRAVSCARQQALIFDVRAPVCFKASCGALPAIQTLLQFPTSLRSFLMHAAIVPLLPAGAPHRSLPARSSPLLPALLVPIPVSNFWPRQFTSYTASLRSPHPTWLLLPRPTQPSTHKLEECTYVVTAHTSKDQREILVIAIVHTLVGAGALDEAGLTTDLGGDFVVAQTGCTGQFIPCTSDDRSQCTDPARTRNRLVAMYGVLFEVRLLSASRFLPLRLYTGRPA